MKTKIFLLLLIASFSTLAIFPQSSLYPGGSPRYLGKLASDPATCNTIIPTWYFNTTSNEFKYCSALNTFSSMGGGGGGGGGDMLAATYDPANIAEQLVGLTATQTLTNKTLTAPVLGGTLTGTYTIGGTPTFPASVVTLTGTQSLSNKTISATGNNVFASSATSSIPISVNAFAGQTANVFNVTSNGGTAGDLFKIKSNGTVWLNTLSGIGLIQVSANDYIQMGTTMYLASTSGFDFSIAGFGSPVTISPTGVIKFNNSITVDRTITAGGTTGNQTINKIGGTVNVAAASSSLTVTNSLVTANSIISVVARTNDSTCSVKNYVPAAGSFVINMTAACNAETSVGFLVIN